MSMSGRGRKSRRLYRFVNEGIDALQARLGPVETIELLCECDDPNCSMRVTIAPSAYLEVRSHPRRFLMHSHHQADHEGAIVARARDYVVVEVAPREEGSEGSEAF